MEQKYRVSWFHSVTLMGSFRLASSVGMLEELHGEEQLLTVLEAKSEEDAEEQIYKAYAIIPEYIDFTFIDKL